jgi:hypothetical protein
MNKATLSGCCMIVLALAISTSRRTWLGPDINAHRNLIHYESRGACCHTVGTHMLLHIGMHVTVKLN